MAALELMNASALPDSIAEVERLAADAEARMAEMVHAGALGSDPYRMALAVLIGAVRVMAASTKASRVAPIPTEQFYALEAGLMEVVGKAAEAGASREARYLGRTLDRRLMVRVGVYIGLAFGAGGVSVAGLSYATDTGRFGPMGQADQAWHDLIRDNPDPRPALAGASVVTDASGRRFYNGVALWSEPSRVPRR